MIETIIDNMCRKAEDYLSSQTTIGALYELLEAISR